MDVIKSLSLKCSYEEGWPSAPPPSPSLGGKRRHLGEVSIASLLDQCCEELMDKVDKMDIEDELTDNKNFDTRLPIKRTKTDLSIPKFYPKFSRHAKDLQYGPRMRPSSNCGEMIFLPHTSLGNHSIGSKAWRKQTLPASDQYSGTNGTLTIALVCYFNGCCREIVSHCRVIRNLGKLRWCEFSNLKLANLWPISNMSCVSVWIFLGSFGCLK